jgi:hypothetical protein
MRLELARDYEGRCIDALMNVIKQVEAGGTTDVIAGSEHLVSV